MKSLIYSEWERIWGRKKTVGCFIAYLIWVGLLTWTMHRSLLFSGGVAFYGFGMDHPDNETPLNALNFSTFLLKDVSIVLVVVILPMLAADSFNGEYTSGALRLVLTRPHSTDEKWSRFVLGQILQNALKYTSQAEKDPSWLVVDLKKDSSSIKLTVRDQGPGIPAEDLPRLFDPFFTGSNGRQLNQATGIGLYLVKQVLDQMGHPIEVHSDVGRGTEVVIRYPASSS